MRLPIDTSRLQFLVVSEAEPLKRYEEGKPREAWAPRVDENGEVMCRVQLVALGDGEAEIIRVAVPGDPGVKPGETVRVCETLGRSGVRVSELCDLLIRDVRLHDPDGARFRIPDAKTEAGIREVQMSPELVKVFNAHFERLRRAGRPLQPDAYAFPNVRGGRISRQRVAKIVAEAAARATTRIAKRGIPPLPRTTPHTLRRTYISIALLANNFDVLWVMGQVGHEDSKMTMDVYAQLQQRVKREHGRAFDQLVRKARKQLDGTTKRAA